MSHIADQVHNKFKIFAGSLPADGTLGPLAEAAANFAVENKIAAKSIGVEFLEAAGKLVLTLGYRTDEEHYPIQLRSVAMGKIETLSNDFSALEQAMAAASAQIPNIICHELYVTGDHDFFMVFMTT